MADSTRLVPSADKVGLRAWGALCCFWHVTFESNGFALKETKPKPIK